MELKCKICNKENYSFLKLSMHIVCFHKMNVKKYYDIYYKKENEGQCLECHQNTNFLDLRRGYYNFCSVSCANKSSLTKNKRKITCIHKYGYESSNKSDIVKKKKEKTSVKNWGETNPMKNKTIQKRLEDSLFDKYNVLHNSQIKEVKKILSKKRKEKMKQQFLYNNTFFPTIGKNEKVCLDFLQNFTPLEIFRNPQFSNFFPDGYIKELNLIIEYDEKEHFTDQWQTLSNQDIRRQQILSEKFNCVFFRIKEKDWLENKESVIENFISKIKSLNHV